jgi:hypothetical protein
MKKFTVIGLVLAIMAVGVFLACAQAPIKTKHGSKYFKIKIDTDTGQIVDKVDGNNDPPTELTPQEIQHLYQNLAPQHIGTLLFTHSSPGCAYIVIGGRVFRVCR